MTNVSSSICCSGPASAWMDCAARRWPAVCLKVSSVEGVSSRAERGSWGSGGATGSAASGTGCSTATRTGPSLSLGMTSACAFFAFFLIFTRSTMRGLHAVLAGGAGDARGVDGLGVLAEGVEERGGGEGVDQAGDAAAEEVDLFHRVEVEWIPGAAGDADAMLDVLDRLRERKRAERVTHPDALPK